MENLIPYITNTELLLTASFLLLFILYFSENKEKLKNETEARVYKEKYQKITEDFSLMRDRYKESLRLARESTEIAKELKEDFEDLIDYWKNRTNQLQKQVKNLQKKCKNNNTK